MTGTFALMSVAHREAVAMAVLTAFFLVIFLLTIRYQRREGHRHQFFWPSLFGVVLGLVLTLVTAHGGVLTGY